MTTRVGINGFGRIGRCTLKNLLKRDEVEIVGINDLADNGDLAYLLKYDSVHGWYPEKVESDDASITIGGHRIPFTSCRDPREIGWGEKEVDVVIESTGAFRNKEEAMAHIEGGAKRVILSAPANGEIDATIVLGVNESDYDPATDRVVSMASCTTNSLAPVARVLHDAFGVEHLTITTVHAYTSSQSLMDRPTRKRRRGRAAATSIIPTTTGAAIATALVIPELAGKMDGLALRVPIPDGSITDITVNLNSDVTVESLNAALIKAAASDRYSGILRVSDEELVSMDIIGDSHSAIVDGNSTMVLGTRVAKILVWYDNEWGYSSRLADFVCFLASKEP